MIPMDEDNCIPDSAVPEGVQLLDLFLKDMDELDASQSKSTKRDPKQQKEKAVVVTTERGAPQTSPGNTSNGDARRISTTPEAEQAGEMWIPAEVERILYNGGTTTGKGQQENSELKDKVRVYQQLLGPLQAAIIDGNLQEFTRPANPIQAEIEEPQALHIDSESAGIFTTLETIVDNRFQDLQLILDKLQLKSTAVDAVEVQICNGDDGTKTAMEYKCVQVLPFDDVAASKAVWNLVEVCNSPQKLSQVVRRSENTYSTRSHIMLHLDQDTMLFAHVYVVVKRHAVLEGSVMLSESTTNWSAFRGASKLWSHESIESGLFVVRRFPLDANVSTDTRTCQHWGCQVNAQICSEATKQEKSGLPSTHAIVLPFYRELLDAQRQFLENRLWDSAQIEFMLYRKTKLCFSVGS